MDGRHPREQGWERCVDSVHCNPAERGHVPRVVHRPSLSCHRYRRLGWEADAGVGVWNFPADSGIGDVGPPLSAQPTGFSADAVSINSCSALNSFMTCPPQCGSVLGDFPIPNITHDR